MDHGVKSSRMHVQVTIELCKFAELEKCGVAYSVVAKRKSVVSFKVWIVGNLAMVAVDALFLISP